MKILNTRILKKSVITLSFLCYLITCGFVPYYYDEATNLCYGDGFFNLFFGWFCFVFPGIFTKIYSLAWFSNITYIVAIRHLIKGNRKHFVLWICITIILIIAHHYFEVDADQIWWIIENELQPLKMAICEMIESLKANA